MKKQYSVQTKDGKVLKICANLAEAKQVFAAMLGAYKENEIKIVLEVV